MAARRIELDIRSTAGTWRHAFPAQDTAQAVIDAAVERFRLANGAGIAYVLRLPNGTTVAPGETLEQLHLRQGQELLLQASQAQDG